jgi:hypothetical protein
MTGEWRKLHNEELHDLYSSPYIIRMTKAMRMRWARLIAVMGKSQCIQHIGGESQREIDH